MKHETIKLEQDVLASQGRPAESWLKPAIDRREHSFQALRSFVEAIPDETLDMRYSTGFGGCGCVLYHMNKHRAGDPLFEVWDHLTNAEANLLFDIMGYHAYPIPTGDPAKAEFLRRIDEVLKG